jgi:hypothetical protein
MNKLILIIFLMALNGCEKLLSTPIEPKTEVRIEKYVLSCKDNTSLAIRFNFFINEYAKSDPVKVEQIPDFNHKITQQSISLSDDLISIEWKGSLDNNIYSLEKFKINRYTGTFTREFTNFFPNQPSDGPFKYSGECEKINEKKF